MAKQTINQGTAPTGAGGDTFRSGSAKLQANDNELYTALGANASGVLPAALPINKGGTGGATAAAARTSLGLGSAAVVNVGKSIDNVPRVRDGFYSAYGVSTDIYLGVTAQNTPPYNNANTFPVGERSLVHSPNVQNTPVASATLIYIQTQSLYTESLGRMQTAFLYNPSPNIYKRFAASDNIYGAWRYDLTSANTTVDGNGFIKNASPIVQLFADKIEMNDEAQLQEIAFEKLGVGDYLIKGSTGFAQGGWYIETPKDANGNLLVAVVYEQLANGDISVKSYDYMLNNKGRIVADTETPLDIPQNRWIDLRLQELPQPETEVTDDPEQ